MHVTGTDGLKSFGEVEVIMFKHAWHFLCGLQVLSVLVPSVADFGIAHKIRKPKFHQAPSPQQPELMADVEEGHYLVVFQFKGLILKTENPIMPQTQPFCHQHPPLGHMSQVSLGVSLVSQTPFRTEFFNPETLKQTNKKHLSRCLGGSVG